MAGADEANGANGLGLQVLAQLYIQGEEWRLHGFHEDAVVGASSDEDLFQLADIEGGGLFAEDVFAGGECADGKFGMGIWMGCDVDRVDSGGEQRFDGWSDYGDREFICVGAGALGVAARDRGEGGVVDGLKSVGKAGGGAAGTYDAESNGLRGLRHGNRVAREGCEFAI